MIDIDAVAESYLEALRELHQEEAVTIIDDALAAGLAPEVLLLQVVVPAIEKVADLLIGQEINLAQHYLSSKICETMTMNLLERVQAAGPSLGGVVVLGTPVGDYHGLGKKIVSGFLRANLIEVIDAGMHVSPETFVDLALEHKAQVIGISSMMVHTAAGPEGALGVRKILHERELEDTIKIMVGGCPFRFDDELHIRVKADGWGRNGLEAVKTTHRLIEEVKSC